MTSLNLAVIFDGLVLLIFFINIYLGYKNGFFKTFIKLVAGIIAIFLSITFAPVFAKAITLTSFLPPEYFLIAPFINTLIWYFIVFIVSLIILKIIAKMTEIINKVPIVGFFNRIMGALISFVYSFVIVAIISIVISLPVFSFKEAYEASFLKPVNTITVYSINLLANSDLEFDTYTDTYKEKLYNWLKDNDMLNSDENINILDIFHIDSHESESDKVNE